MNPAPFPTTPPADISVTEPISRAIEHVKQTLFRPFDIGKWFTLGFCAWLAGLGESGGGFNFRVPGGGHGRSSGGGTPREELERAWGYLVNNLDWLLPLIGFFVVLGIAVGITFIWINSRGKFMFLHCLALDKAEVAEPWRQYAAEGNSLFLFRLVLGVISSVICLPVLAVMAMIIVGMVRREEVSMEGILICLGLVMAFVGLITIFAIIQKLTTDFVVPIMYLRRSRCLAAWQELRGLLTVNAGRFVVYILFQIVITMVIGTMIVIVVLLTCCIAGCLLAIPYLGTVLLLPVLVFQRSYSLHYFRQYGPAYDVFAPLPASPSQ